MNAQRCSGFTTARAVQFSLANATIIPRANHARYLSSPRSMMFMNRQDACDPIIDGCLNLAAPWQVSPPAAALADRDATPCARRASIVLWIENPDQERERQERDEGG